MFKKMFKMFGHKTIKTKNEENIPVYWGPSLDSSIKDESALIKNRLDNIESVLKLLTDTILKDDKKPTHPTNNALTISVSDLSDEAKKELFEVVKNEMKEETCLEMIQKMDNETLEEKKEIITSMIIAGVLWSKELMEAPLYITEEEYEYYRNEYELTQKNALEKMIEKNINKNSEKKDTDYTKLNIINIIEEVCNGFPHILNQKELYDDIDETTVHSMSAFTETNRKYMTPLLPIIDKGLKKIKELLPSEILVRYNDLIWNEDGIQYYLEYGCKDDLGNITNLDSKYKQRIIIDAKNLKNYSISDKKVLDKSN